MPDWVLDFLVAFFPIVLSLVGVWTLEPWSRQHKSAWRFGLIAFGAILTVLTWLQQTSQKTRAVSQERELREQIIQQAEQSDQREQDLTKRFEAFVVESSHRKDSAPAVVPQGPSADEIAVALEKRLRADLPTGTAAPKVGPERPPVVARSAPAPVPATPPVGPITQPCRGDRLSACSDEQLLEWGKPLVENMQEISDQFTADEKKLDDIKGGKMDWLRELAGTGGDKDSKWLKGYETANRTATEKFRDCCAERALAYHKEIVERDHTIPDDAELYGWVENLLQPEGSKQWKTAREEGPKVGRVYFDLNFFLIHLNYHVSIQHIGH